MFCVPFPFVSFYPNGETNDCFEAFKDPLLHPEDGGDCCTNAFHTYVPLLCFVD